MRNDMHENRWSPFDPQWYQKAFDQFISTADELFNQDTIMGQGYSVPDPDGSKSSVFRKDAILNNSFNETILRDTLKDIYENSTHKLIASNHDNTGFFQWFGHMSDLTLVPSTNLCQITLPTDTFIGAKERDSYKLSSFMKKWIKIEDILNNWDIFRWHCMVFIDQKISSEYEFHIDDHEVTIRFPYYDYWLKANHRVYIYKFPTNAQCRIKVSRELCENQWNWKMPISYISDQRVINSENIMVAFNKIADQNIRTDGITNVEMVGDNLEFLKIKDGYVDLTNISKFNKIYIHSELTEWLWMSIVVPKFFHEYPILLPTDVIYRPYEASFKPVLTMQQDCIQHVKTNGSDSNRRQVYVDINGELKSIHNGWKQMIRPVVLSDAFDNPNSEPYDDIIADFDNLRDLTVKGADVVEDFRFFLLDYTTDEKFNDHLDNILKSMGDIHACHNALMDKRLMEYNEEYERRYAHFKAVMNIIRADGCYSEWLNAPQGSEKDFFEVVSPCIYIPREFADKYYIFKIINGMSPDEKVVWENVDNFMGRVRFQRPIEVSDFWTFEYDVDGRVWRPFPLKMEHHFPDVYIPTDTTVNGEPVNRVFKTFFFYSDTINVMNESREMINASPDWSDDSQRYYFEQGGTYRDIFMEKFYWMGVRSIYKGLLRTKCRWEVLEYIIDNSSYQRFNDLFMKTMDPYFKLGLATYLKSSNYNFPFDDAVEKMQEAIDTNFLGYKRVTNFEAYLNRSWIPSYFDFIEKVMDDYDYSKRLLRRPRSTFDIQRLLPILTKLQEDVFKTVRDLRQDIEWILERLSKENYRLDVPGIRGLKDHSSKMLSNIDDILSFTKDLDLEIYSIDDINKICDGLQNHFDMTKEMEEMFTGVYNDASDKLMYVKKDDTLAKITEILNILPDHINSITSLIQEFDMDGFMKASNDLRSYFDHAKTNPDDNSLLGHVNQFNDAWSKKVQEKRDHLFSSTTVLYGHYDPNKSYDKNEVDEFISIVSTVRSDIDALRAVVEEFWTELGYTKDQDIINRLDYAETFLTKLCDNLSNYSKERDRLISQVDAINEYLEQMNSIRNSETEVEFIDGMQASLNKILAALSYVVGKNNKLEAYDGLQEAKNWQVKWIQFVSDEHEVFDHILKMAEVPSGFIAELLSNQDMIEAAIEFMRTVNSPFNPDGKWPTYSDIYSVDEVEMISGGFLHKVGDIAYIPNLGSYKITSVDGNVSVAKSIEDTGYRKTTFRDPFCNSNPYDSITDGTGMGLSIRPISISHQRVINDEVTIPIVQRIQNASYLIDRCIALCNPYNNLEFTRVVESIGVIQSDWQDIIRVYNDYMTSEMNDYTTNLVNTLATLIDPCNTFIETRKLIDLGGFLSKYEKYIIDIYSYAEEISQQDPNFFYYDDKIRTDYNEVKNFYDNGTTWNDANSLKQMLDNSKYPIKLVKVRIVDKLTPGDKVDAIIKLYEELLEMIDSMLAAVNKLPDITLDITPVTRQLNTTISNLPTGVHKDLWYKIKHSRVADEGSGYKVGDIVEIIPELPVDDENNPITALEDVVMNDVILLQVSAVENGSVIKVTPMIDYALPYKIWGIRDTKTRVGSGYGLKVDMYSYELQLADSTLFNTVENDVSTFPPFDENDLFMFKFENIHDLDIGYEVFLGGRQITNFTQRHETDTNHLHPKNIDVLYLNANEVMGLRNSSIYIPAEHYFVYRIDEVEIKDPGAGYYAGQDIFVDTDQALLRLKVAELMYGPTKSIAAIDIADTNLLYKVESPASDHAKVVTDSMNNIDDEFNNGYYDHLTQEGIQKDATRGCGPEYVFESKRFDDLEDGDRNKNFMHPDVDMPSGDDVATHGDPDNHWYLGSRVDNSQHPMEDPHIWNGIMNLIPPTHPFIPDALRLPDGKRVSGEYQLFKRVRIHNSTDIKNTDVTHKYLGTVRNAAMIAGDFVVPDFEHLPRHTNDYPGGKVGKCVIVEKDETNEGHRMMYRIRTFVAAGFFVYDLPEIADEKWDHVDVDWMNSDYYPDMPTTKAQYPSAPWNTASTYRSIRESISDNKHAQEVMPIEVNNTTYIHQLTVDDLSVFNWTTKQWEDLHDETRWRLDVKHDDEKGIYGFTLTFLKKGLYSYDMSFYWNKLAENQMRNAELKKDAVLKIAATISSEVNNPAVNTSVYTGRHIRIRKLFPYEQKESYTIGKSETGDPLGYKMDFKLAPYIHFRNEIHLEDIKVYNKSAGRFENILDPTMFEVRFKDPKAIERGYETQTKILQCIIGNPGEGFVDGEVWAWNAEFGIHIFGHVTADMNNNGRIISFTPDHCPNPPKENVSLEFQVYQHVNQFNVQMAIVVVEFQTQRLEVFGDGYIHNVTNRLAVVPDEFKVIAQYNLDGPGEYDIIISKRARKWSFRNSTWMISPTFHLDDCNVQQDRLYVLTSAGRFPLVNPSTGRPTLSVSETGSGTDVTFLNMYKRYERIDVCSTPYPMRSVYVQRRIPKSGYIDLAGKINKPLNKKYFEFWVNGKLLFDEVTIVTPTKLFLHGLTSLKNLEIIEVNRDPNEYFSDAFLDTKQSELGEPSNVWNYRTYLDDALEGTLEGDNYTPEEQEYLLTPVWKQVERDHPEYKNYPPNVDIDDDILVRTMSGDNPLEDISEPNFQFMIVDAPTIEGHSLSTQSIKFEHFGFIPIDENMIVDLLNDEWADEIARDPYFPEHSVMTDDEWYGMTTRLYDEFGILVHNLNAAAYKVVDSNLLRINKSNKISRIVNNPITYDLT